MGTAERAWLVCGYATIYDEALPEPELVLYPGEVPLALIPARFRDDPTLRELAYRAIQYQAAEEREGFLGVLRLVRHYTTPLNIVAASVLFFLLDANRDGIADLVGRLLR